MTNTVSASLFSSDGAIRLAAFLTVLVVMLTTEWLWPRRRRMVPRRTRWFTNFSFVALGAAVVRFLAAAGSLLLVPLSAVGAAYVATAHGIGVFHVVSAPTWLAIGLSVIVLDFAIWFQHYAAHHWHWLWRLHRVHHADVEFDASTALRFHPIEIGLSMIWKVLWVLALGAPAVAVVAFEVILNALALFNHANLALPAWLDRALRPVIVTPDMHRVHHSTHDDEHRSNFGFNLAIWDRVFGTYVAQPRDGHTDMKIGLSSFQTTEPTRLGWSLKLPFMK